MLAEGVAGEGVDRTRVQGGDVVNMNATDSQGDRGSVRLVVANKVKKVNGDVEVDEEEPRYLATSGNNAKVGKYESNFTLVDADEGKEGEGGKEDDLASEDKILDVEDEIEAEFADTIAKKDKDEPKKAVLKAPKVGRPS